MLLVSTATVKLIGAIFKIPLANVLGDDGFGSFSAVYDLFTPFYALAMTGLPVAASKLYAAMPKSGEERTRLFAVSKRLYCILGAVATALFCAIIPLLLPLSGGDSMALLSLCFVAPAILLFFPLSVYRGWYEGHNNMLPTAVSDLIEAVGKLALGLGLAAVTVKLGKGSAAAAAAALLGITLGVAAAWGWTVLYSKSRIPKPRAERCCGDKAVLMELLKSAASIGAAAVLLSVPASLIDAVTVRPLLASIPKFAASAQALYGVRGRAFTLFNLVPSVTAAVGISFVPQIAKAVVGGNIAELKNKTALAVKAAVCISLPAGFGLSALSGRIFNLLYSSSEFNIVGAELLKLYGLAAVFAGISIPVLQILQAIGKQREVLIILIAASILKLAANPILITVPGINIKGAAISTALLYFAALVLGSILLIYKVGSLPVKLILQPLCAAILAVAAAWAVALAVRGNLGAILAIFVAIAVYIIEIIFLKAFKPEELEILIGKKCK